jgi:hypothetical protein
MNLKAKIEKLEDKVGIRKETIVVQMPGESEEEVLRKVNVFPGSDVKFIKVRFVNTNVPRVPNE